MDLKTNAKPNLRMDYSKNSTIKEQEGRHCATIVPIWGVEDVEIKEHFPYHWGFITLLLPENKLQKSSSGLTLNSKHETNKKSNATQWNWVLTQEIHYLF